MVSGERREPSGGEHGRSEVVERATSRVLFWGGSFAIAVVLVGLVLQLALGHFAGEGRLTLVLRPDASGQTPGVFVSIREIVRGLRPGRPFDPLAVVAAGLGLLLLTPVVGVAVAIPAFAAMGDYRYVVVSMMVLGILIVSFFVGGGGG